MPRAQLISDPDIRAAVERSIATSALAVPWAAELAAEAKAIASAKARVATEAAIEALKVADSAAIWTVTLASTSVPYAMSGTPEAEWTVEEAQRRATAAKAAAKKATAAKVAVKAAIETYEAVLEVIELAAKLIGEKPRIRDSAWLAEQAEKAREAVSEKLDEPIDACRASARQMAMKMMLEKLGGEGDTCDARYAKEA